MKKKTGDTPSATLKNRIMVQVKWICFKAEPPFPLTLLSFSICFDCILYIRFDPHAGMRKIKAVNEFSTMGKFQYNKYIAMH